MAKWFQNIFGFKESVSSVYKYIKPEVTPEGVLLHNEVNGKTYQSGILKPICPSDFKHLEARGGGKFNIIRGHSSKSKKFYLVDILTAQTHPDNDGATFQAASNYNALEFTSCCQTSHNGISSYPFDTTQGPYCAMACAASILFRNYFVQVEGNAGPGQYPNEINLLGETPIPVEHGYVRLHSGQLEKVKFDWENLDHYKVAAHINCQVTTNPNLMPFDGSQISHHCYCAAFNFAGDVAGTEFNYKLALQILKSQYRSTILQAWENSINYPGRKGSNKCFLTLVGGGVFRNPHELICEAIKSCKDVIVASGLEVYLMCYSDFLYDIEIKHLRQLMKETGGTTIETN